MKYCSECGSQVRLGIPVGDERERHICDACGVIHYHNPKVIAGCIPVWGERVLLCRRAIEPRLGLWTLPAGFMETGENLPQAAQREAREEANVEVEIEALYNLFSLPHISQVYVFFRASMIEERFFPGYESLETRLFSEEEIPWDELAFETVRRSLAYFFADRSKGEFILRMEDVPPLRR
ncbi:MAG: NUDIX hydrolase [Methylococcaceae bacterium]|nr:NUDIX hydrolase [Methylococcaceae bacterium]